MKKIIDIAYKNNYHSITLQLREPSLKKFYQQFGFKRRFEDKVEIYALDLKW
jgi:predicted GNAT family N-acyltransferase